MVIYDKPYFSGKSRTITGNLRDFISRTDIQQTAFMYTVGSLKVLGGVWVLLCNHWTLQRWSLMSFLHIIKELLGKNNCIMIRHAWFLTSLLSPWLQLGGLREGGLQRASVPAGGGRVPRLEGVGRLWCWAALCQGDTSCKSHETFHCS